MIDTRTASSNFDSLFYQFLDDEITPQSEPTDMEFRLSSEFVFSSFHSIELTETSHLPSDRQLLALSALYTWLRALRQDLEDL